VPRVESKLLFQKVEGTNRCSIGERQETKKSNLTLAKAWKGLHDSVVEAMELQAEANSIYSSDSFRGNVNLKDGIIFFTK